VIGELAALTPGAYIHIGGDEAQATEAEDYKQFIERVQTIVQAHGKRMVGWEEIAQADLLRTSIAQHWYSDHALDAIAQGAKIIMSPASKAYVDMKYDGATPLGLDWAGYTSVRDAYTWDPATKLEGASENDVLGLEAPLWTETIKSIDDIEFMAFPRMIGYAEIGWSPAEGRDWFDYIERLATHGARLEMLGVNFFRSPEIPWR
jgi:hexosaminidase